MKPKYVGLNSNLLRFHCVRPNVSTCRHFAKRQGSYTKEFENCDLKSMMNTGKMVMQEKYFHTQIPNFRNMSLKITAPNLKNVVETSVDSH